MPKLWHDTIEAHRTAVADAIMDHTAALVMAEGLHALTMARIAQESGIGRATLYKYFKDVEEILASWHQRQVSAHLADLEVVRAGHPDPLEALEAVLIAYARHGAHDHHGSLGRMLHTMPHVQAAHRHLRWFVAGIVADAAKAGGLHTHVPPEEGAGFAIAALETLRPDASKAQVTRLVGMILRGLGAPVDLAPV